MLYRILHTSTLALGLAMASIIPASVLAESHAEMADKADLGSVVAKVGDAEITLGHMIAMATTLTQQQQQMAPDAFFGAVLERLIQQEAVAQSAGEVSRLTELQLENERRSLLASQVVERISAEIEVSPEQVRAAYDARFAEFTPATEYNASHILVATEEEAQEIIAAVAGGADFAATAREKSTGPSGPNGGQLGWFGPGRMVPSFEEAVKTLEVGQVSPTPVQTQFGWHVIKLNDSRTPEVPAFEAVEAEIGAEVERELFNEAIFALIDGATVVRMDIDQIDPEVLLNEMMMK